MRISPVNCFNWLMALGSAPLTSAKPPVLISGNASEVANKTRKLFSQMNTMVYWYYRAYGNFYKHIKPPFVLSFSKDATLNFLRQAQD